MSEAEPTPHPAATLVVLRDGAPGGLFEVLLLQRRTQTRDSRGNWVFPGGHVDPGDRRPGDDPPAAARRAAAREAEEEAGLRIAEAGLVPISRWITPAMAPRRFDTYFFATTVPRHATVTVDGSEISDHRWLAPRAALEAHETGEIRLLPPTYVTVHWLLDHPSAVQAIQFLGAGEPPVFRPRMARIEGGMCLFYPGDAGYETQEVDCPGARHRLWALDSGWRYEGPPRG